MLGPKKGPEWEWSELLELVGLRGPQPKDSAPAEWILHQEYGEGEFRKQNEIQLHSASPSEVWGEQCKVR